MKYKVITDNLDFLGIKKGSQINSDDDAVRVSVIDPEYKWNIGLISEKAGFIQNAIDLHPDWFQKIKTPVNIIKENLELNKDSFELDEKDGKKRNSGIKNLT